MSKTAVIFALDNSNNEPQYEAMSVLLVKSILEYSTKMDIYCGVFTQRTPGERVEMLLKDAQVNMVYDQKFTVEKDSINYFLRNYCCYYFSHEHNLLEEYDKLIYLDMDVLVMRNLVGINIPDNSVLVERVPDNILEFEKEYIGEIDHPLYYNWMTVVNEQNKFIWDIDYTANRYLKQSDILVSQRINNSDLNIVDIDMGAYYPKSVLLPSTIAFHYDGFIDSGSFYKLEQFFPQMYKKYSSYAKYILNITQENDKRFWDDI
jgi:lipopolysaccharide biosynthesis glycosyltransferase